MSARRLEAFTASVLFAAFAALCWPALALLLAPWLGARAPSRSTPRSAPRSTCCASAARAGAPPRAARCGARRSSSRSRPSASPWRGPSADPGSAAAPSRSGRSGWWRARGSSALGWRERTSPGSTLSRTRCAARAPCWIGSPSVASRAWGAAGASSGSSRRSPPRSRCSRCRASAASSRRRFAALGAAAGAPAPPFELPRADGGSDSLASYAGRVVLLHFWATWCPPCRRELPALAALRAALGAEGLTVLAISVDAGSPEAVERFAAARAPGLAVLLDPREEVARRYGVGAYPTSVVIDRSGRVVQRAARRVCAWNAPESVAWFRRCSGLAAAVRPVELPQ